VHRNRGSIAVFIAVALAALLGPPRMASAQTFTTLVNFDQSNGAYPSAGLLQGLDGNLYGTTYKGGSTDAHGTVFKVTPEGVLTTLLSFCAPDGCKYTGEEPTAALIQAADGIFYGTAQGGANDSGVVFSMTSTGSETVLYNFCAQPNCTDGSSPNGLVQASGGDLYGTTFQGGLGNTLCFPGLPGDDGCGTVFKITPAGVLTTVYSFCSQADCTDGDEPAGSLVQGTDGNFYGTTSYGGNQAAGDDGRGTAFRLTPSGILTTLYTFCSQPNCSDGDLPDAGLVQGTDGNFYGTTGGFAGGAGTIFRITSRGAFTTLYSFCAQSGCPDGAYPEASLVQASDGNFYGTTTYGGKAACGTGGCGTIFRITPSGVLTTLVSFDYMHGAYPEAALVQDTNGMLYGTTALGGSSIYGTLYSLDLHLARFVKTLEPSGKVGATIQILGTALTGATSVTFNGTPATFKVISPSEIGTTVPTGATTGTVQVVTPTGTLSSNVAFQVLP
jgi:uncharacterized repeat protein (TIGR03803 family)